MPVPAQGWLEKEDEGYQGYGSQDEEDEEHIERAERFESEYNHRFEVQAQPFSSNLGWHDD